MVSKLVFDTIFHPSLGSFFGHLSLRKERCDKINSNLLLLYLTMIAK